MAPRGITVELEHATVAAFEQALAVVRQHPTCQEFGEGKTLRVRATYQFDELDALNEVKEAAWELRHKRCWIDGKEVPWHEMAEITYCFREYLRKPKRDHCFFDGNFWSNWGCKYAVCNLADRINTEWLTFGQLDGDGAWVFDKARIAERVRQRLHTSFHLCPAFDEEFLNHVLEVFPERVDPVADDRWRYVRNRQGQIIYVGPKDVDSAKKIVQELQEKVRQRRSGENVAENGKRPVPESYLRRYGQDVKQRAAKK
ncbi:MAG TPA: hypothetical protein VNN18_07275 [Candidatus Xenobia bacterium]|nr:hypothetical protein [Candidatus Xenobia bacterium]